jgi:hypothetical protein
MPNPLRLEMNQIYENLYSALAQADSTTQLWVSLTFAVIVAVHLGAEKIEQKTFKLIAFLYGLFSIVAVIRYIAGAYQILHYQELLITLNFEPWPIPNVFGMMIGIGTFILILVGSLGTLWFIRSNMKVSRVIDS